jgi:hypothetical protein
MLLKRTIQKLLQKLSRTQRGTTNKLLTINVQLSLSSWLPILNIILIIIRYDSYLRYHTTVMFAQTAWHFLKVYKIYRYLEIVSEALYSTKMEVFKLTLVKLRTWTDVPCMLSAIEWHGMFYSSLPQHSSYCLRMKMLTNRSSSSST